MPRVGEESQQVCVADALGGGIHQRVETEQLVLADGIVEQHLDPVLRIVDQRERRHAAQFDAEVFAQALDRGERQAAFADLFGDARQVGLLRSSSSTR